VARRTGVDADQPDLFSVLARPASAGAASCGGPARQATAAPQRSTCSSRRPDASPTATATTTTTSSGCSSPPAVLAPAGRVTTLKSEEPLKSARSVSDETCRSPAGVLSPPYGEPLLAKAGQRTILVTVAAGFLGSDLCERSLDDGYRIIGLDCLCDSYEASCKLAKISPSGSTGARRPTKSRV